MNLVQNKRKKMLSLLVAVALISGLLSSFSLSVFAEDPADDSNTTSYPMWTNSFGDFADIAEATSTTDRTKPFYGMSADNRQIFGEFSDFEDPVNGDGDGVSFHYYCNGHVTSQGGDRGNDWGSWLNFNLDWANAPANPIGITFWYYKSSTLQNDESDTTLQDRLQIWPGNMGTRATANSTLGIPEGSRNQGYRHRWGNDKTDDQNGTGVFDTWVKQTILFSDFKRMSGDDNSGLQSMVAPRSVIYDAGWLKFRLSASQKTLYNIYFDNFEWVVPMTIQDFEDETVLGTDDDKVQVIYNNYDSGYGEPDTKGTASIAEGTWPVSSADPIANGFKYASTSDSGKSLKITTGTVDTPWTEKGDWGTNSASNATYNYSHIEIRIPLSKTGINGSDLRWWMRFDPAAGSENRIAYRYRVVDSFGQIDKFNGASGSWRSGNNSYINAATTPDTEPAWTNPVDPVPGNEYKYSFTSYKTDVLGAYKNINLETALWSNTTMFNPYGVGNHKETDTHKLNQYELYAAKYLQIFILPTDLSFGTIYIDNIEVLNPKTIDLKPGDVDKNDSINTIDAMMALQLSVDFKPVVSYNPFNANVDNAEGVSSVDAMLILQKALGMEVTLNDQVFKKHTPPPS